MKSSKILPKNIDDNYTYTRIDEGTGEVTGVGLTGRTVENQVRRGRTD
jgi:hypothetical protein